MHAQRSRHLDSDSDEARIFGSPSQKVCKSGPDVLENEILLLGKVTLSLVFHAVQSRSEGKVAPIVLI